MLPIPSFMKATYTAIIIIREFTPPSIAPCCFAHRRTFALGARLQIFHPSTSLFEASSNKEAYSSYVWGKKNPHKFHLHKFFSLVLLQEQSFKDIFWRRLIARGFSTNDGHTTAVATKNKMKELFIFTQYKRKMLDCHVSTTSH